MFVRAEGAEFFKDDEEVEGEVAFRFGEDGGNLRFGEMLGVAVEEVCKDGARVVLLEWFEGFDPGVVPEQAGECSVLGLAFGQGDDGGEDTDVGREVAREPVHPMCAVRGVELVERVENEDDALPAREIGRAHV